MQRLTGLGVSAGVATGRALVVTHNALDVRFLVPRDAVTSEVARLAAARDLARQQLQAIKARIAGRVGTEHAYLFDAQLLMLDDPMLVQRAEELVREERLNAEWAVRRASDAIASLLDGAEDRYLRERKGDIDDLVGRIQQNLRGERPSYVALVDRLVVPCVLVADSLPPSMVAQLDWTRVGGFATDAGSWTYHTAILARSMHVPAVVGLRDATRQVAPGAFVLIDGSTGDVVVDPPDGLREEYEARRARRVAYERHLRTHWRTPAETADGHRIRMDANLELPGDLSRARDYGADGIGLYRSEFLLVDPARGLQDEEAQLAVYRDLLEQMAPSEVTVRTFDTTDEAATGEPWSRADESRDRMGLRALRMSLARREAFRVQLRALLRAARYGSLRIMFPFVSSVGEFRQARAMVTEVADELRAAGETVPEVPVGVMIEVPGAALTADLLAREADFFSIGTNDLIQYSLAVDRTDERVSHLYDPLHPAILRLIRLVARAATRAGRRVSVCGEMASDPLQVTLLLGLGITEFSMTPAAIPVAKQVIRDVRLDDARRLAARALRNEHTPGARGGPRPAPTRTP